ncbi:TRAP transporter small permease [Pacificispira sp.]|uniref:TRAP transporter small permease n=1 Tax=Pacificispira sp. TaxID=2888761 RepID=UPI003BAB8541
MNDLLLRSCRPLVWLSGGILLLMAFSIAIEVVVRKAFNISLGGVDELAGYGFAAFCSVAFSVAAVQKANIRIEALYHALPDGFRIGLDLMSLVSMLLLSGLLAWGAVGLAWDSYLSDRTAITPLATPLIYPQAVWGAGFLLFAVVVLLVAADALVELIRGDRAAFFRIAGPVSEADAVDREINELAEKREGGGSCC